MTRVSAKAREVQLRRIFNADRRHIAVLRRVLRLVDGYLARQDQDVLLTDGRGLMTWGEIRNHIEAARSIKAKAREVGK